VAPRRGILRRGPETSRRGEDPSENRTVSRAGASPVVFTRIVAASPSNAAMSSAVTFSGVGVAGPGDAGDGVGSACPPVGDPTGRELGSGAGPVAGAPRWATL